MQFTTSTLLALLAALPSAVTAACLEQPPATIGYPINYDITPERSDAVSFQIPPDSVGPCQLVATFPAGYDIESTGSDLVNVTAIGGPAPGALVGALRFRAGTTTVINSFACRDVMAYELAIAHGDGEVKFQQLAEDAGLFMYVGDCSV
ncbi:hypothetical protein GGR52DRAFT_297822 [Hypoxylon sp. FL1284]|nr:hypothetical protein GGR52DRAFT_297822 [Hypoxylon sp. FL1284]